MQKQHGAVIDQRCRYNHTVKPIHDAAVSRYQFPVILDIMIALDTGCRQISNLTEQRADCGNRWKCPENRICHIRSSKPAKNISIQITDQCRAKYAKLHVKSWWEALIVGFQYRLFRHLQKRLGRRGIHLGTHA